MPEKPMQWEMPPITDDPYNYLAPDEAELDLAEGHDAVVLELPVSDEASVSHDWVTITDHKTLDSTKIEVHTSDAARIMGDKYSTQPQRAARIVHDSLTKLAEAAGIHEELVMPAGELEETYYQPATYLLAHAKTSIEVEVVMAMIDEGLEPYLDKTPVPIAGRYLKLTQYRPEASVAVVMAKLWAADMHDIDLPHAYEEIRQLEKPNPTKRPSSGPLY